MKCAHVADIHLDERRGDHGEGLDESVERLLWIGEDAHKAGAEIMFVAGDTFQNSKSSAAERNAAIKVYQSWAELFPVVVVKGNNSHDGPGEITLLGALKTKYTIHVFERPGSITTGDDSVIACLPFPEKNWLAAKLEPGQDVGQVAAEALRAILLGWKVQFDECLGPRILLGHVELGSAVSDSGQPMVGKCVVEMSEGDLLDAEADYYALGHIHAHQIHGKGRICYAGSVRQCTFGEDNKKGYVLVDVERGKPPVIEHRRAPGRELITVTAEWMGLELNNCGDELYEVNKLYTEAGELDNMMAVPEGSIVRLKYQVPESDREQAAEQAENAKKRWLAAGAHSVKLDVREIPTYRVRSEAIREAKTNTDKLEAWWDSRGDHPERAEKIKSKLNELEAV